MKFLTSIWKRPSETLGKTYKQRLAKWRSEPAVMRLERPTRPDRARSLGYKAKQGICVARVRTGKGGRKTPDVSGGRRPMRSGRFFNLNKSKKQVAEEKVADRYSNMEVVNSYWVGQDGDTEWYEVILADRSHPSVKKEKNLGKIISRRGRASRGLTSAGKKSRGNIHKGKKS